MSKGETLIQLFDYGLSVPELILLNDAYTDKSEKQLLEFLSKFDNSIRFAVRSSASVEDGSSLSYAGIFQTYLNIHTSKVSEFVEKCFAARFSDIASAYEEALSKGAEDYRMGVVVERMVDADISGVMFTSNPMNSDREFIIECAWGLGEQVVSGEVDVDRIQIDPQTRKIKEYKVGYQEYKKICGTDYNAVVSMEIELENRSKKKLGQKMILGLVDMALEVESYLGKSLDIEWCISENKIWLLQARPITTGST